MIAGARSGKGRHSFGRGPLLDLGVVGFQVGALGVPHGLVVAVLAGVDRDRFGALVFGLVCFAMLVLPAVAAVLKRWSTHERWRAEGGGAAPYRPGCLFHPIVFFALGATLASAATAGVGTAFFGARYRDDPVVFTGLLVATTVLAIVQTVVVYRYFEPPRRPPRYAFLRSAEADRIGDVCLYVNMALFQVVWDEVASTPFTRVAGIEDVAGRIVFFSLAAGLVYLPPRMLYLVEDLRRPGAWLTLVAAHAAMVVRMVLGGA